MWHYSLVLIISLSDPICWQDSHLRVKETFNAFLISHILTQISSEMNTCRSGAARNNHEPDTNMSDSLDIHDEGANLEGSFYWS